MTITKDNYRDIVWDEKISNEDYFAFYDSLEFEEQVAFLRFLLETYPDYDDNWMDSYFEIADTWRQENTWERLIEFSDFVREKSPINYKKNFNYLIEEPTLYAVFYKDIEKVKIRFSETISQHVEAIDLSLPSVFNILSTDAYFKDYTKEVAEKVWKTLAESDRLIGDPSYNYTAYLYCDFLEAAFKQIQTGESVDWEAFKTNVERINFKHVNTFSKLPNLNIAIENRTFRTNPTYRDEKLAVLFVDMLYEVHTTQGLPVYWLYRTWSDLRQYLWKKKETTSQKNWFGFTPKMLNDFKHNLRGSQEGIFIAIWTFPYIFDYLLKKQYVDEEQFSRLMKYYQYARRDVFRTSNQDLWKYKALYDWHKPAYISAEEFEQEKQLVLESTECTREEAYEKTQTYLDALPVLPSYVTPPKEPSLLDKIMTDRPSNTAPILSGSGVIPKFRKKKPKKKKHKDNRKQGSKKERK